MITDATRDAICAEALTWLGTPYHHQAAVKGAGADCARYPIAVYAACGAIQPVEPQYLRDWHIRNRDELYMKWIVRLGGVEIPEGAARRADFLVWRFGNTFSHGGIILDPAASMVIHSYIGVGVGIDDYSRHEELRTRERKFFTLGDA